MKTIDNINTLKNAVREYFHLRDEYLKADVSMEDEIHRYLHKSEEKLKKMVGLVSITDFDFSTE